MHMIIVASIVLFHFSCHKFLDNLRIWYLQKLPTSPWNATYTMDAIMIWDIINPLFNPLIRRNKRPIIHGGYYTMESFHFILVHINEQIQPYSILFLGPIHEVHKVERFLEVVEMPLFLFIAKVNLIVIFHPQLK